LAVFCSDERFVSASLEFLRQILKTDRFDLIALPGAPAFIAQSERSLIERLKLLLGAQRIKRVVLIAHEDCGYYKNQYPGLPFDEIRQKQLDDLSKATEFLKDAGVDFCAFFAFVERNEIVFDRVR